jgi:hypothetical protein
LTLGLTWHIFRRDPTHARAVTRAQASDALHVGRLLLSFMLVIAVYSNLKPMVSMINPVLLDPLFHRIDCLLALGHDPFVWLTSIRAPWFVSLMDESYFFFFFFIVFGLTGSILFGSRGHFERAFTAFLIAYMIGLLLYYLLPSVGPAFAAETRGLFEPIAENSLRGSLWSMHAAFQENPQTMYIVQFSGLAAFPSLHIAHSVLFIWYLWRVTKPLALMLVVPFVLLALSTVHLGWHYIVDIPGGIAVAALSIWCAERLCRSSNPN